MKLIYLFFLIFLECKDESKPTSPLLSFLVGAPTPFSPQIQSVEPKIGNPGFTTPSVLNFGAATFPATKVIVRGRNFMASTTGNTILFNGTPATVEAAYENELRLIVPDGATSGPLSITNNGGRCNSSDKRTGPNCTSQDFFINCYLPYKNSFGAETNLQNGIAFDYTQDSIETKTFRTDLLSTIDNNIANNTISIYCASLQRVLLFSETCSPREFISNGSNLVLNPNISINSKSYTIQFFVTSGKGSCRIKVN